MSDFRDQVFVRMEDYGARHGRRPSCLYVGNKQIIEIRNITLVSQYISPEAMKGKRGTFNGLKVYRVDSEDHLEVGG